MRENDCTKDWKEARSAMQYMGHSSGATVDLAKGALIGARAVLMDTHHLKDYDALNYLVRLFPADFRIECIPPEWIGLNQPLQPEHMKKITSFEILWNGLPDEEKEKNNDLRYDLMCRYINIIPTLLRYAERAEEPEVKLFPFTKQGTQWIADFVVFDLKLTYVPGRSNWHGENPSQWAFRGCILVQDGKVSIHT